jgi:hypothetical protein
MERLEDERYKRRTHLCLENLVELVRGHGDADIHEQGILLLLRQGEPRLTVGVHEDGVPEGLDVVVGPGPYVAYADVWCRFGGGLAVERFAGGEGPRTVGFG